MALFATKDRNLVEKKRRPAVIEPPVTVIIGFSQTGSARDAEGVAKGYVNKNFAVDISWYAVAPFSGGYLYEVHQGGNGVSYLPEVLEVLNANTTAGVVRIPSGNRVMQVSMREGSPVPLLLSETDSRQYLSHPENLPLPSGKMKEAVKSGLMWVYAGVLGMSVGTVLLFGSIGYYFMSSSNEVLSKQTPPEQMPHRQWETVRRLRTDQYVSRLKFENNRWSVDFADSPPDPSRAVVRPAAMPPPPAPTAPVPAAPAPQTMQSPPGQPQGAVVAPQPIPTPQGASSLPRASGMPAAPSPLSPAPGATAGAPVPPATAQTTDRAKP